MGQFGVAGNRKQGGGQQNTKFQELQEMAKKQQGGGGGAGAGMLNDMMAGAGGADYQKLLADAMNDPATMEQMKQYGEQFSGVLEQMMKMSPEELEQQLSEAMKLMSNNDELVDTVLSQKETVLQTLEASGTVPPEELAKYKADPEYFELKMRESFDQMKEIFSNPEYVAKATEAMTNMKGLMDDPTKLAELTKSLTGGAGGMDDWTSDEKLEEVRLQFLRGEMTGIPGFDEIFQSEEMQEILKDPVKWKETVKDGLEDILNLGAGAGGATPTTGKMEINDEL